MLSKTVSMSRWCSQFMLMRHSERKQLLSVFRDKSLRKVVSRVYFLVLTDPVEVEFALSGIGLRSGGFSLRGHQMAVVELAPCSQSC